MKKSWFILLIIFTSCLPPLMEEKKEPVSGYIPIYGSVLAKQIKLLDNQVIQKPGKIYTYGSYLLINEINRGIHVYNNADPSNPRPKGFIEIVGNTDMAIKDDVLYVNHMGNLVSLKVADFETLEKTGELKISNWFLGVPPPSQSYFECIVPENGLVIGWKQETLQNPACYAF